MKKYGEQPDNTIFLSFIFEDESQHKNNVFVYMPRITPIQYIQFEEFPKDLFTLNFEDVKNKIKLLAIFI